ncbi:hypothetical protein RHMOL_Rhmol07G0169300 [Rhododendron molle]|uniref:Uncharacterized protein n=1 Tax=Rhododendron molle TaxID=49168 RepID=A0ACC0N311_RHOML|nr:hypothetical protein RHMOL_Rhmol07G0169300 [Rhododendron molle]
MDFMKVIDQTVREIKREVNLKVLKVPEIEQKVLDATDDEPWGPHGSALAEIAQATKKFSECQMVMNVLWTRLGEIGKNWRYVYKSLASFEYVEPNGKDMGINVRKKAEAIVSLLNNKDKIQEVRNKAAANREKYFGLSSTGITYKSGSVSSGSSSFQNSDRYGGFNGTKDSETFKDTYSDNDRFGQDKSEKSTSAKSHRNTSKKESSRPPNHGWEFRAGFESKVLGARLLGEAVLSSLTSFKGGNTSASGASRPATANNDSDKYASVPAQNSIANSNNDDDFDPRGTSGTKSALGKSNQVDLFGQSLVGDLMDAPASVPEKASTGKSNVSEVDLFADATFVSAPPHVEAGGNSEPQAKVDLFASKPALSPSVSSSVDFFATPDPIVQTDKTSSKFEPINTNAVDPFAAVPLNSFDGSDLFGAFTSNADASSAEATKKSEGSDNNLNGKSSAESKPPSKKDSFQVKSGIWSDSLSRGLIDLNISAPKKVSLADIGIVGGLSAGSDEKDKGPPTSFYMGRAMGAGSGIGRSSGFTSSTGTGSDDMFSNLGAQQYQFGGFK